MSSSQRIEFYHQDVKMVSDTPGVLVMAITLHYRFLTTDCVDEKTKAVSSKMANDEKDAAGHRVQLCEMSEDCLSVKVESSDDERQPKRIKIEQPNEVIVLDDESLPGEELDQQHSVSLKVESEVPVQHDEDIVMQEENDNADQQVDDEDILEQEENHNVDQPVDNELSYEEENNLSETHTSGGVMEEQQRELASEEDEVQRENTEEEDKNIHDENLREVDIHVSGYQADDVREEKEKEIRMKDSNDLDEFNRNDSNDQEDEFLGLCGMDRLVYKRVKLGKRQAPYYFVRMNSKNQAQLACCRHGFRSNMCDYCHACKKHKNLSTNSFFLAKNACYECFLKKELPKLREKSASELAVVMGEDTNRYVSYMVGQVKYIHKKDMHGRVKHSQEKQE